MADRIESGTRDSPLLDHISRLQAEVASLGEGVDKTERLASLGLLAGLIVHEFNNILTPISSSAQLAPRHPQRVQLSQRALLTAYEGAARATRVADLILEFVRPGTKGPPLAEAETCSVLAASTAALQAISGSEHIRTRIEVDAGLVAKTSRFALETVLLNLVLNAKAAINPDGGEIAISAESNIQSSTWNTSTSESRISIVVRDTGKGMGPALVGRLNAQERVGYAELGAIPGNGGFGLTIARALVRAAGGHLAIASKLGEGTVCSIVLPGSLLPSENCDILGLDEQDDI